MEDIIVPDGWDMSQSIIKVIGVGGGGCNAVSEMFRQGIKDVEFMVCNTDIQSLKISQVPETLRLGSDLTRGLGAGCDPEKGRKAATESIDEIRKSLQGNTEMVFITAGMGGGTGTGAAPVIAQVAKELGKLTVAVVTLPFRDEGPDFIRRAILGIRELRKYVDSLLIIDNQKLYKVFGDLTIFDAFPRANEVLSTAVRSIALQGYYIPRRILPYGKRADLLPAYSAERIQIPADLPLFPMGHGRKISGKTFSPE